MKRLLIIIVLLFITGCRMFDVTFGLENQELDFFKSVEEYAYIDTYTIYGRYFNLSGELPNEVENLVLVLKNKNVEFEYPLITEVSSNKTKFKTNELINEGINLENIKEGEYIFLLKDTSNKYYTLKNKTSYDDLEYYTITRNNKNYKIDISFNTLDKNEFLSLNCNETSLPTEIYDIVVDPGHGGDDSGASKNGYYESHINLDYAKKLKNKLEKLGLKVKLTREDDSFLETYGKSGRVSIPYKTKAKLMLSIHMNSSIYNVGSGGVEIYIPNKINTTFATNLAKNIVGFTSTNYSKNVSNKIDSGVYLRTLSQSDLEDIKEDANKKGFTPYERATIESVYYYIIRETGGIITNAYVDSRNKEKEWNHFYNSNHGCETYLLELGYINSSTNLNILLNEKEEYVKAISLSVKQYLEI